MKRVSHRTPIRTPAGWIRGRDAIFLDEVRFAYSARTIEFVGQLNASLCSNFSDDFAFVPYCLRFADVLVFRMIELDFDTIKPSYESSFDAVEPSSLLASLRAADHSAKVSADHRHFVLTTYDDVFEVVASDFQLDARMPA